MFDMLQLVVELSNQRPKLNRVLVALWVSPIHDKTDAYRTSEILRSEILFFTPPRTASDSLLLFGRIHHSKQ